MLSKKQVLFFFSLVMFVGIVTQPILAEKGYQTFNLKLNGGFGSSGDSDLGAFVNSHEDYTEEITDIWGLQKSGNYAWGNLGSIIGGEFMVKISRRFGFGFGIEHIAKNKNNHSELGPTPFVEGDVDVKLQVTPLTFSVYSFFPISQKADVYVKGGAGYYSGQINSDLRASAFGDIITINAKMQDKTLGFQGGLGIEYKILGRIALFAEGGGRLVKFSDWEGDETETGPGYCLTEKSAQVWLVDEVYRGINTVNYYPSLYFGEKPEDSAWIKNARRFSVDFSAFTFKVGIGIGF